MLSQLLIDIALGAVLGVVGGLFGIGGGLIAIPVLALLFGLDQQLAQGTALVMVVPNVLLSVYKYNQRNRIDWQRAGLLAAAGMLSALAGTALAVSLDARSMRHGFVGFLLVLVLY
ncbi:sulfite exporter TauE/SafE family protein, partial [Pseudomonas sp. BAV 2493]